MIDDREKEKVNDSRQEKKGPDHLRPLGEKARGPQVFMVRGGVTKVR